ncbi:MAG: glutathione S-transferase family protein [Alphaproteobacteria bacterium]
MYKLYDSKATGSACVHALLEEIGTPYDRIAVDMDKDDHRSDWFTKINPRQQIPALELPDGSVMSESAAMLLFLADTHPQPGLIGETGSPERARTMRWMVFISANIYEGLLREFYADRYIDDAALAPNVTKSAVEYLKRNYKILEATAGDGAYLFGDEMNIVDLYLWMLMQWWDFPDWMKAECPKLSRIADTVKARPKVAPVHKHHFG